jgi:hypothetical protein
MPSQGRETGMSSTRCVSLPRCTHRYRRLEWEAQGEEERMAKTTVELRAHATVRVHKQNLAFRLRDLIQR